jgi:hypothetical protein
MVDDISLSFEGAQQAMNRAQAHSQPPAKVCDPKGSVFSQGFQNAQGLDERFDGVVDLSFRQAFQPQLAHRLPKKHPTWLLDREKSYHIAETRSMS